MYIIFNFGQNIYSNFSFQTINNLKISIKTNSKVFFKHFEKCNSNVFHIGNKPLLSILLLRW